MWEKIKGVKKKMSTERAVRRPWVLMADWTTVAAAETEERTISERLRRHDMQESMPDWLLGVRAREGSVVAPGSWLDG